MNVHPDGLCTACRQHPETISHFLLECPANTTSATLREQCLAPQLEPTLMNILVNRDLQDLVYQLVLESARKI